MKITDLMNSLENVKNQLGDITVLLSDTSDPKRAHDIGKIAVNKTVVGTAVVLSPANETHLDRQTFLNQLKGNLNG